MHGETTKPNNSSEDRNPNERACAQQLRPFEYKWLKIGVEITNEPLYGINLFLIKSGYRSKFFSTAAERNIQAKLAQHASINCGVQQLLHRLALICLVAHKVCKMAAPLDQVQARARQLSMEGQCKFFGHLHGDARLTKFLFASGDKAGQHQD